MPFSLQYAWWFLLIIGAVLSSSHFLCLVHHHCCFINTQLTTGSDFNFFYSDSKTFFLEDPYIRPGEQPLCQPDYFVTCFYNLSHWITLVLKTKRNMILPLKWLSFPISAKSFWWHDVLHSTHQYSFKLLILYRSFSIFTNPHLHIIYHK